MRFNNVKLSAGILYIGLIVSVVILGLYFNIANLLTTYYGDTLESVYVYFFFFLILTLPFDILADKKLNSPRDSSSLKIIVSNVLLFLFLIFFVNIIHFVYNTENLFLAFTSSMLLQLSLVGLQEIAITLVPNKYEETRNNSSLLIIKNAPTYMTMNIVRTLKGAKIIVPGHWREQKEKNYHFHLKRFELIRDLKVDLKSIFCSILINSILFTIIFYYYSSNNISTTTYIINLSLLSNLISFIYILVLPRLSQNGISNIDAVMKTVDLNLFKENLEIFESNQDKNKARGKITETVFYPIPSIKTRVDSGNQKKFGLSNISRLIIFFASFNLSIIFKGVHGNAGKPENWLFPPSE